MTHETLTAIGVLSHDMGYKAYLVGGIVRDVAIGFANTDLDIVIDGDGVEVARTFASKTGTLFKGPTRFGTCKVDSKAFGDVDFATARTESYRRPGALPDVKRSTIAEDLVRRDFTINAMAISLDPSDYGKVIDPYGGLADIRKRRLRVLHDGSFQDDPTRILRGIRFAVRYGYGFERKTLEVLRECVKGGCFQSVSGKRIYAEIRLICMETEAAKGLSMLARYGILSRLHPVLGACGTSVSASRRLAHAMEAVEESAGKGYVERWLCWFSGLFAGTGRRKAGTLVAFFNLPSRVRDVCMWVSDDLNRARLRIARLDPPDPYKAATLLKKIPPEGLVQVYAVSGRRQRNLIRKYLADWRHVGPRLTGGEIAAMGFGEGPHVGVLLERILKLRLQGRLKTRADEIAYVTSHRAKTLNFKT